MKGSNLNKTPKKLSPMRAIRLKCLDCMCNQIGEVGHCSVRECSLWQYRHGKRPETARKKGKDA